MDKSNKFNQKKRNYTRTNYVELVQSLTPSFYQTEDINLSGTEVDILSKIINSHITIADNIESVIPLSTVNTAVTALPGGVDPNLNYLNTIQGIAQYFIKQYELTKINPYLFELKILLPLGYRFSDFNTEAEFSQFLEDFLLPKIIPPTTSDSTCLENNIAVLSSLTEDSNASSVHNYLIDALGWFYFLNTSGSGDFSYSPSSYVKEKLTKVYLGESLETVDGIKGLTELVWRNYNDVSLFSELKLIPDEFVSSVADSITTDAEGILPVYTSGTQKLQQLNTLNDIIYSPLFIDQQDYRVKEAFDDYINSNLLLNNKTSKGPFRKFCNMLGYFFGDINNDVEKISTIYDIDNIDDDKLQYLANHIGFNLRGFSPSKWRQQLRNAVDIYKKSGTLASIQAAVDTLVTNSIFDLSGKVVELHESYLPYLIWYTLATECPFLKNLQIWTASKAAEYGIKEHDQDNLENSIKLVVDAILLDLYKKCSDHFIFEGIEMPVCRFYEIDNFGAATSLYTVFNEPYEKPYTLIEVGSEYYEDLVKGSDKYELEDILNNATVLGPLGSGIYIKGDVIPEDINLALDTKTIEFLKFEGDLQFLFNYRGKTNYPLPPFEEFKYYKNCRITPQFIDKLREKLLLFDIRCSYLNNFIGFITKNTYSNTEYLGYLNNFLMMFSNKQYPPNFNYVLDNISDFNTEYFNLWNGKSSHLFVKFKDGDFDFSENTLDSNSNYVLNEVFRIVDEYSPAHAIPIVVLELSDYDNVNISDYTKIFVDKRIEDIFTNYAFSSVLGSYETSGVAMGSVSPGNNLGRGGLNTFQRNHVNDVSNALVSSTTAITSVPRRSFRRKNYKFVLPKAGFYDRTGFNGPTTLAASSLEFSKSNNIGELPLGFIFSSSKFHPVVDPIYPSGVWDGCETIESQSTFFGVDTSNTFPYRATYELPLNQLVTLNSSGAFYLDRCQLPMIYSLMHKILEARIKEQAKIYVQNNETLYSETNYYKNNVQSLANEISFSTLNSFDVFEDFSFGRDLHEVHRDYCKYFDKHPLFLKSLGHTGGSIFAQIFGKGLFNCSFDVNGSGIGNFLNSQVSELSSLDSNTIWNYDLSDTQNYSSFNTYIASGDNQAVLPLTGNFIPSDPNSFELRNPYILSGIEFCNSVGGSDSNKITIYRFNKFSGLKTTYSPLIDNTVIEIRSSGDETGALPRLRFDLSSYGDRRNYFIKEHEFDLSLKFLVGKNDTNTFGNGSVGVWIHTEPKNGLLWSWTKNGYWEPIQEDKLNTSIVKNYLAHRLDYGDPVVETEQNLLNLDDVCLEIQNTSFEYIKDSTFRTKSIKFNTINYNKYPNMSRKFKEINPNYSFNKNLKISPDQDIHTDDTNYIVHVFFYNDGDYSKYLLIDDISLTDETQKEKCSTYLNTADLTFNVLDKDKKIVKYYFTKEEFREILQFYNGMIGLGKVVYNNNLLSRDASITSGVMEASGGSRLNFRIHPDWLTNSKNANYEQLSSLEIIN